MLVHGDPHISVSLPRPARAWLSLLHWTFSCPGVDCRVQGPRADAEQLPQPAAGTAWTLAGAGFESELKLAHGKALAEPLGFPGLEAPGWRGGRLPVLSARCAGRGQRVLVKGLVQGPARGSGELPEGNRGSDCVSRER